MYILGLSAFYHDSAAALLHNGKLIAAAQEERFTRKRHDPHFPTEAVRYCLDFAHIDLTQVSHIIFYDKPLLKLERLLETYLHFAPRGARSFVKSMPVWIKEKLFLKRLLREKLKELPGGEGKKFPLLFNQHHQSHAASAFFPSPFERAAVLCLDGVGEWATTSVWLGEGNQLIPQWQIDFPHSLGLLYSAFTYYTGFRVNSGEYKLMGLAPYGKPIYVDKIRNELINIKSDGTFRLNMHYFDFATGLRMTNSHFDHLFGGPPRLPESALTQKEMDLAASVQKITEEIILKLAHTVRKELATENLCLAGGVALNCVANGRLLQEKIFSNLWVQPAAGDAGGAIGAAYSAWHEYLGEKRIVEQPDSMSGALLGPEFIDNEIEQQLIDCGAVYSPLREEELLAKTSQLLAEGNIIGWFQGRMEFGPRALGSRSILADPRSENAQSTLNQKIKFRESFRPFAPAVLEEYASEWFNLPTPSSYMQFIAQVSDKHHLQHTETAKLSGIDLLKIRRTEIPAVTHVDFSARVQTVNQNSQSKFRKLLESFHQLTSCPILVNTSFNVRGEPIVCSPLDAYNCFMRTNMDYLVIGDFLLRRSEQPYRAIDQHKVKEFNLD